MMMPELKRAVFVYIVTTQYYVRRSPAEQPSLV